MTTAAAAGNVARAGPATVVAAHRGARRAAPENTLAAFAAAIALGARALELDVRLTSDGAVVALHDERLERTTDGSGAVGALPVAAVRELDAGSWFSSRFAGERVPLLDEVIDLGGSRTRLHVELKGERTERLAAGVVECTRRHGASGQLTVMGSDLDGLVEARRLAGDIPAILICSRSLNDPLRFALTRGLSGLNQAVCRWNAALVTAFHERALLVHGSLVNDESHLAWFSSLGGDLADSDEPSCFATGGATTEGESHGRG